MPKKRQVYLLDPQKLSPEVIAVTFAKTSRSPESFREIASGLTGEKSAEFHEKWVVGYGHASVAEHAVLHVAVENASRLAVESLESNRLASYTEKSTRYQQWQPDGFFTPPEIQENKYNEDFQKTCRLLFSTYLEIQPQLNEFFRKDCPCENGESDSAYERRVHAMVVDVSRFLLPAAALANVGVTINARALEHTLRKMLSHPLQEVQDIGAEIKASALSSCPTLIKYTREIPYLISAAEKLRQCNSDQVSAMQPDEWCIILDHDRDGEDRILAAALYRYGSCSYQDYLQKVKSLSPEERRSLAESLLGGMDKHDIPIRELEYALCTFDLVIDQGAFYELKRHRMMTLTPQDLTCELGYAIPYAIVAAGVEKEYRGAMETARDLFNKLHHEIPRAAAYIVPNGFNRRVLIQSNLRSLFHLICLRSAPGAHFSMRRLARRMAEETRKVYPLLGSYLALSNEETWQQVESRHFHSTGI